MVRNVMIHGSRFDMSACLTIYSTQFGKIKLAIHHKIDEVKYTFRLIQAHTYSSEKVTYF